MLRGAAEQPSAPPCWTPWHTRTWWSALAPPAAPHTTPWTHCPGQLISLSPGGDKSRENRIAGLARSPASPRASAPECWWHWPAPSAADPAG